MITALKNATDSERQKIFKLFEEKNETLKISNMLAVFDRLNVKEQTFAKMEKLYNKSLESLSKLSVSATAQEPLFSLANMVYQRDH